MTIPLGFMAERYGRRTVLWLNLVPRICMLAWAVVVGHFEHLLPTKAIIASPLLSILGGDCVFNSITLALASDLTEDRVLRATYFGYMSSTSYIVALLGPGLASATMSALLWLPFCIGIVLLLVATRAISALPSDTPSSSMAGDIEDHRRPLLSSPILKAQDSEQTLLHSILQRVGVIKTIISSHPRNFTLLLISFFLSSLASSDTKLLVQYISKRYHWTFASAGYLLSGKAVVNFTLLTIIIPRLLKRRADTLHLASQPHSQDIANIRYAKLCLGVSVAGALAIALAATIWLLVPSLLLYSLGSVLPVFTLSLLKSPLVSPPYSTEILGSGGKPETHIFSIVMLVKTLGSLVGAPLMATVWIRGIGLGGAGLGMPYYVSAICYGMAVLVFSGIRVNE